MLIDKWRFYIWMWLSVLLFWSVRLLPRWSGSQAAPCTMPKRTVCRPALWERHSFKVILGCHWPSVFITVQSKTLSTKEVYLLQMHKRCLLNLKIWYGVNLKMFQGVLLMLQFIHLWLFQTMFIFAQLIILSLKCNFFLPFSE